MSPTEYDYDRECREIDEKMKNKEFNLSDKIIIHDLGCEDLEVRDVKEFIRLLKKELESEKYIDELIADFIADTGKLPSQTSIMELMDWSFKRTGRKRK
jgi:hypothetical protein